MHSKSKKDKGTLPTLGHYAYLSVPPSCLIRLQDLPELHTTVNGDTKQEADL